MNLRRKQDRHSTPIILIHGAYNIIIFIMLIASRWNINLTKHMSFILLARIYLAMFQKNKIYTSSDDPLVLFFNMIPNFILLIVQIILVCRNFITRFKISFYLINGTAIVIGMLNKIVGFKEAWDRRSKLVVNLILLVLGLLWIGYLFRSFENINRQEIQYNEKKISQMEQKSIANKEIK